MASIRKLDEFSSELYSVLESVLIKAENKIHSIAESNKSLKDLLKKVESSQTALFYVLTAYNLYQNPVTFGAGALMGIYASVSLNKNSFFPSLQSGPIMNLAQPGMLVYVTVVKGLLGNSVLDTTFFRMFAGVIVGNALYHSRLEARGRNKQEPDFFETKMRSCAQAAAPFINKVSNLFTEDSINSSRDNSSRDDESDGYLSEKDK